MGAVHFSIDPVLLRRLAELLPLRAFVATGPDVQHATGLATPLFDSVHTTEAPADLGRIGAELTGDGVIYWHDPHPPAVPEAAPDRTHHGRGLLAELDAIGPLNPDSVVMIDDARLFLSPPPPPHDPDEWPDLNQVAAALRALSDEHELMVVDDVIVLYPARIRDAIRAEARQHSLDWLGELARAQEVNASLAQLRQRLEAGNAHVARMEVRLEELAGTLADLGAAIGPPAEGPGPGRAPADLARRVGWLERRYARRLLGVPARLQEIKSRANRLGALSHHPPKPLHIPASYSPNGRLPDPPIVSIVTPSLNQGTFLAATIESVLGQGYPTLEYVVQDGGSNDGTREILERYAERLHHWDSAPDEGQTQALNLGFAHTSGEVMAYLNSDDMLLPGTLHYVARYFREHPEVDVVYGHRVLVDEQGQEIGRWVLPPHDDEILSWADFIPQETLFWRRSAWEAAGNSFDESFRFAMDWDALVRLREAGARMVRLPRFLGAFRVHEDQKTTAQGPTLGLAEMDRIRRRLHGREVSHDEVLRHIRPYLIRHVLLDQLYRRGLLRH